MKLSPKYLILIGERKFLFNESNSIYVSIGLVHENDYKPSIELSGNKEIWFSMKSNTFLNYQGVISNYLYSTDVYQPIYCGEFSIYFEYI